MRRSIAIVLVLGAVVLAACGQKSGVHLASGRTSSGALIDPNTGEAIAGTGAGDTSGAGGTSAAPGAGTSAAGGGATGAAAAGKSTTGAKGGAAAGGGAGGGGPGDPTGITGTE